jgi:hypothetical protein
MTVWSAVMTAPALSFWDSSLPGFIMCWTSMPLAGAVEVIYGARKRRTAAERRRRAAERG